MCVVQRFVAGCRVSRKIEHVIMALIRKKGAMNDCIPHLDIFTSALANPSNRRHAAATAAVQKIESAHPWIADVADFKAVVQDAALSVDMPGAHNHDRSETFCLAFDSVLVAVRDLDSESFPTGSEFLSWLWSNKDAIESADV